MNIDAGNLRGKKGQIEKIGFEDFFFFNKYILMLFNKQRHF